MNAEIRESCGAGTGYEMESVMRDMKSVSDVRVHSERSDTTTVVVPAVEVFSVVRMFGLASLVSLVYVIFPCLNPDGSTNFWVYAFAKQEWWALFTNAAYVEFADACLPGSSDHIYVYSYIFGALVIPLVSAVGYAAGLRANYFMNILIIGGPIITTFIFFGLLYPMSARFNPNRAKYGATMSSGGYDMLPSDMFALVTDVSTPDNSSQHPSVLRAQWMELTRRLTACRDSVLTDNSERERDDSVVREEDTTVNPLAPSGPPLESEAIRRPHTSSAGAVSRMIDVVPEWVARYRMLPRFWSTPQPWAHITTSDVRLQVAFTFIFLSGWIASYFSFVTFAELFRAAETHSTDRYAWFGAFCASSFALKVVMRKLGLLIDQGKVGTTSMFFIAEFMMSLFYFGYYRMLFEEFVSWPVFAFVQVVHFALEWLVYCFRASGIFYEFISAAERSLPASWRRYSSLTVFITKGLSHRDWQMFLAVELQLRLIALAISAPAFALLLFATARCWWVRSELKPVSYSQYADVLGQVALCLLLEGINCAAMYHSYYKEQNLPMFAYIAHCFRDPQFRMCCFLIASVQFTNPFVVYENYIGSFSYQ